MANVINWFEIPVKNFDRASKFYSTLLDGEIQKVNDPKGIEMGLLPGTRPNANGGAIVKAEGYEPSDKGSIIYLECESDLATKLNKVEKAGGKVVLPKTRNGNNGFIAHFIDSEGNKVALHAVN
jgi:predicted enzyme related to lactoylglutathione lyase